MKPLPSLAAILGVAAGALLFAGPARATTLTYTSGDLFLGFRATGGTGATQDYVVNVGQYTQFTNATSPFSLSLGNVGADLTAQYGASWNTRADLFWSVSGTPYNGTTFPTATLFATKPRAFANLGTPTSPYLGNSPTNQKLTASYLQGFASHYVELGNSTANSSVGVLESNSHSNSYSAYTDGSNSYLGNLDFGAWADIEGTFENGTSGIVLDLYQINPVKNQSATLIGTFTISNSGVLTFTPVPEPTVLALITLFGLFLLLQARIRSRRSH